MDNTAPIPSFISASTMTADPAIVSPDTELCALCHQHVPQEDTRTVLDDLWCDNCYETHGDCCDACDRYLPSTQVATDRNDNPYCTECQDNGHGNFEDDDDDDDDDDSEYDGQYVHEHDANVFDILGITAPSSSRLHYGFEIELNTRYDSKTDAAKAFWDRARGRGIVKHDGSIGSGRSGIELVSVPLSLDEIRLLISDVLRGDGLHDDAFADSSCGMHVHVSRAALATSQLAKLVRFIHTPRNVPFMERLAGRTLRQSRWASIDHRSASWKAVFLPEALGASRITDGYRYSALNLTNDTTIEFRIFASTTDVTRARANIEACAALLSFCSVAARSIADTVKYEAFMSFIERHSTDYPHLFSIIAPSGSVPAATT